MTILNFLSGYKTFITGVAAVIWGVHTGDAQLIFTGFGLITMRQAIAKIPAQNS